MSSTRLPSDAPRLALVLWNGELGGAENLTATLAERWRAKGIDASVVFVAGDQPLARRLDGSSVPHANLGLGRGSHILKHPRRFAGYIADRGRDGALLVDCGYMSAALRIGGYRGLIIGVEHGRVLRLRMLPPLKRWQRLLERALGSRARCVDVAVSDFLLQELKGYPHARELRRIRNGVDLAIFSPKSVDESTARGAVIIGFAGRLVPGKGLEELLHALALLRSRVDVVLKIAGDGPLRLRLQTLAEELGLAPFVQFDGPRLDVAEFWGECHVAVVPSTIDESFSMSTLEAMACGLPVVASAIGGIPEVLGNGETGLRVPPADPSALADAMHAYAVDVGLRERHGALARQRAVADFDISDVASQYLGLFGLVEPAYGRA